MLSVEDDININNLLKTALLNAGYKVIQAFSGTEAQLVMQMKKEVSLILLDLMLPGLSGEELLNSIREKGNLPVIVLTAKDEVRSRTSSGLGFSIARKLTENIFCIGVCFEKYHK